MIPVHLPGTVIAVDLEAIARAESTTANDPDLNILHVAT
jgi:hypothetical protein